MFKFCKSIWFFFCIIKPLVKLKVTLCELFEWNLRPGFAV